MKIKLIKFTFSLCMLLMILPLSVYAQGFEVKGRVFENSKANPLIGGTVMLMNANNRIVTGAATDIDGNFKIIVPDGITKISFSFIGLTSQTLTLEKGKVYEVILEEDSKVLGEVIVKGRRNTRADLGMFQKDRREVVSAVTSIDMKALQTSGASSIEQMLQGAAPGMLVTFNSGDPGAGASINIRGITSLSGNSSPLWIIDGAEVISDDYSTESLTNFGYSPIGDIDPNDIEAIDILKDASATAIYGSRGANGVIVIRTKRGVKGKPSFSFSAKLNTTMVPERVPMLNGDQQRIFLIESRANSEDGDDGKFLPKLRGDLSRKDAWRYNNNTDWFEEISRTGFQQDYTLSLRGGGDRLNYYWGLGYTSHYGTTVGGGYDRFTSNVNLDYSVSDKLKISTKFSYTHSLTDKRSAAHPLVTTAETGKRQINPVGFARARGAYFPIHNENGTEYDIERAGDAEGTSWTSQYNPLAVVDYSSFMTTANRFMSSLQIRYELNKWINFYSQVSVDYRQSGDDYFMPPYAIGAIAGENNYNYGKRSDSYQMKLINNNRVYFTPISNEKHHVGITAVADIIYNRSNSLAIAYSNGAIPELREADASARIESVGGGKGLSTSMSMVVDIHYKLMERYNLNVSLKTEGSSMYGKDNPYSIFPTLGFAYDMKKEWFFADKEWINLIKPRFGFGLSGKLPAVSNILSVSYGAGANGYLGDSYTYINKFAYDNVHEERTIDLNYGLDWELFENRLSGEFNYYTRKTSDLLLLQSVASSTGFPNQYTNFGTIKNKGWEFGINVTWIEKHEKRFRWKTSFNIAHNRNELVELPEKFLANDEAYSTTVEGFKSKLLPGDAIGGFYAHKALGVYANDADAVAKDFNGNTIYNVDGTPKYMIHSSGHQFRGGDMIYQDINHDGLINELDVVQVGDANPDVFGMLRNDLNWKQWTLSIGLFYKLGQDVINGMRKSAESMTGEDNQARSIERRWRKQGDITYMPRAEKNATWNTVASSRWVEDASYIKLKELSLTYQFDQSVARKLGLKQFSIWGNAQNLFTWTKYKGIDPEIGTGGGIAMFGIDRQTTAPPIMVTFGIRASF